MTRIWIAVATFLFLCCTACNDDGVVCTDEIAPGLVVTIVDALTGAPRSAIATAVATERANVDTLRPYGFSSTSGELSKSGVYERPGTYDLRVTAPGYLEWTRASIRVGENECHVRTVELEARLVRDSSNNPPSIVALPDTFVALGDTLRLRAVAQDPDGDPLTFLFSPQFRSFRDVKLFFLNSYDLDPNTGEFLFAPSTILTWTLRIVTTDGRGGTAATEFRVEVRPR